MSLGGSYDNIYSIRPIKKWFTSFFIERMFDKYHIIVFWKKMKMNQDIQKRFLQVLSTLGIQGTLLFIFAGTVQWLWAWAFIFLGLIILGINYFLLPAEVVQERGRKKENVKKWDKLLTSINIFPTLGIFIISGLDYRFGWSAHQAMAIHLSGLLIYFLGSMLFTWSMVSNRFFSTMVRLQKERGHQVASGGPYRYIRHPGYTGFIVMLLAIPFALGTLSGLWMSGISSILFVIRTALEDMTLKKELKGYSDYSRRVKYRLIPYIW